METIRVGLAAKSLLNKIMQETDLANRNAKYQPLGKGVFKQKASNAESYSFIAFDNSTGDCWIESFNDINQAFSWCK